MAVVIALAVVTTFFLTKRGSENPIQSLAVLPLEFAEALESLEKAALLDKSAMVSLFRAHVHAVAGNKDRAQELVNDIEEAAPIGYMCPYEVATRDIQPNQTHKIAPSSVPNYRRRNDWDF
jgi:hypothetical protein